MPPMVEAIVQEIDLRQQYITTPINTIYFGGGTPSLCTPTQLQQILQACHRYFSIDADAEITLEANPDDVTTNQLQHWQQLGINRLSIGIQSFFEADLQWMNRAHNVAQAKQSIVMAQQMGITNINIDLIYGTPSLSNEQWQQNVATALALGVKHISCYALTVEPKTTLDKLIKQQKVAPVDAGKQATHFELLMQWMEAAGMEHYEISNFALPGYHSKHNKSYWQNKHYIGIGPSAHSFNGTSRQWNVANNMLYLKSIQQNTIPMEIEYLTATQQLNEYIMTSLRTKEGLDLQIIATQWGQSAVQQLQKAAQKHAAYFENQQSNKLQLNKSGKLFADGIAADLFASEPTH